LQIYRFEDVEMRKCGDESDWIREYKGINSMLYSHQQGLGFCNWIVGENTNNGDRLGD
jgi:hypothetical protein